MWLMYFFEWIWESHRRILLWWECFLRKYRVHKNGSPTEKRYSNRPQKRLHVRSFFSCYAQQFLLEVGSRCCFLQYLTSVHGSTSSTWLHIWTINSKMFVGGSFIFIFWCLAFSSSCISNSTVFVGVSAFFQAFLFVIFPALELLDYLRWRVTLF